MKKTLLLTSVLLVFVLILTACGGGGGGGSDPPPVTPTTYTVTYNGNGQTGGSVPIDTTNYETGNTVTVLGNTGNLVKAGSTFAGWNTMPDGSGTSYTQGNTFAMGSVNVTLYAKWTVNPTYTVTYNGNGQTGGSVPADTTNYETGAPVTVLGNTGNLEKTDYAFIGWNTMLDGSGTTYTQGNTFTMGSANVILYAIWVRVNFSADGVSFKMVHVPGKSFPTGTSDAGTATVASAYSIGETEVTYDLWKTVYIWASANGYNLQNFGTVGSSGAGNTIQPVTMVNWRDAMVWTNAATEWYNNKMGTSYTPVYTYGGVTIKDSRDTNAAACDGAVAGSANGFRLLTSNEWELAARYKVDANSDGDISDLDEYYPGNYASGATLPTTDTAATGLVAWYSVNSGGTTHDVKTRAANALGLYDMSGNVREWCFDLSGANRIVRGGSWNSTADSVRLGYVEQSPPATADNETGLRLGRSD